MSEGKTQGDLAGAADQAAATSRPADGVDWQGKYNGAIGRVMELQNELAEAREGLVAERTQWEDQRGQLQTELERMRALEQQLDGLQGERESLSEQLRQQADEVSAATAALTRHQVLLKYPALVSDPVLKLVQSSTLSAEDLEEALSQMAQGQQQMVKAVIQEAQTGSTQQVDPGPAAGAEEEQAQAAWQDALDALRQGDMDAYRRLQRQYTAYLDKAGKSRFTFPPSLSRPMA